MRTCFRVVFLLSCFAFSHNALADQESVQPVFKLQKDLCASNLESVYDRALADSTVLPSLSSEPADIEKAVQSLGLGSDIEEKTLIGTMKLRPLLDSGLVYQAVAYAYLKRGVKKKANAISLIKGFKILATQTKREIIESIIEIINYSMDVSIDISQLDILRKKAARFGMDEQDYVSLISEWKKLNTSNFEEAKLALLDLLNRGPSEFIAGVLNEYRKLVGIRGWINRLLGRLSGLPPELIVDSNTHTYELNSFQGYIRSASVIAIEALIKSSMDYLHTEAHLKFLQSLPQWNSLDQNLRDDLVKKVESQNRRKALQEKIDSYEKELASINEELNFLELENQPEKEDETDVGFVIEQIRNTANLTTHNHIYDALNRILSNNARYLNRRSLAKVLLIAVDKTSGFNSSTWLNEVLSLILNYESNQLTNQDFTDLALAVLRQAYKHKEYNHIYDLFLKVVNVTKKRKPCLELEKAIKNEIAEQIIVRFKNNFWINDTTKLINHPWWPNIKPRTKTELEGKKTQLEAKLKAANEDLEHI